MIRKFGLFFLGLILTMLGAVFVSASEIGIGTETKLPIPRYVSLKVDRVNMRAGPSKEHEIKWIYQKAGLPVEVTAEFETWRRIRDSSGIEGWVMANLISSRRTALITPWLSQGVSQLHVKPDNQSALSAQLSSGVLANLKKCDGKWCSVSGEGFSGFVRQERLWGAYPEEKID
ncbi:MAG: SH3 domain-containing protein [Hyphomicrobiales bacterium]